MKNIIRSSVSIALGAAGLAVAIPSQAEHKVYAGSGCTDLKDTMSDSNVYYGEDHYLQNNATGANTVGCPLARDNIDKGVSDWDVTVDRRGNTDSWSLTLFIADKGGSAWFNSITVPASPSTGLQHLDGGSIGNQYTEGMLYVTTIMPAGARLHRVHVQETD